jgi:sugar phosphate isomerase/epimerase
MKLAYSTLACPNWTIEEAVAAAARYGYDAIEWRVADGEIIGPETLPAVRQRMRTVPVAHGIAVASLDTSCQLVQPSLEKRLTERENIPRLDDMAVELGAPFLRISGGSLPPGATRAAILEPAAEVLHTAGTYAAGRNVTLILETHDAWTQSADMLALLQAASAPATRVLWDIHHTYRAGEAPAQSVAALGPAIAYVHIKDGRMRPDGAWELCLLNEGTVPLREACTALQHGGYDGYLSLEWEKKWHPELAGPEVALPQAVPWLRSFLQTP